MSDTVIELTDIDGVAKRKADRLIEEGFETPEDVATSDPSDLQSVKGLGPSTATDVIESAKDLVRATESASGPDIDIYSVDTTRRVQAEVHSAILTGALRARAGNEIDRELRLIEIARRFPVPEEPIGDLDEDVTFSIALNTEEYKYVSSTLTQHSSDLRARRGITALYAGIDDVVSQLSKQRDV